MINEGIRKTVLRQGYYIISDVEDFLLSDYAEIVHEIPFKCDLVQNYFKENDWVILCKEIMDDRKNCFWWGQDADSEDPVENPITWIHGRSTWKDNPKEYI